MSGLGDKLAGKVNEVKGDAKQEIGTQTGDAGLAADGKMDEVKGKGQGIVGDVKGAAEDIKNKVSQ